MTDTLLNFPWPSAHHRLGPPSPTDNRLPLPAGVELGLLEGFFSLLQHLVVGCRLLSQLLRQGDDLHRHVVDLLAGSFDYLTPLFDHRPGSGYGFLQSGDAFQGIREAQGLGLESGIFLPGFGHRSVFLYERP